MCENLGFWNYFKKEKPLITTIPCSCEVGEVSTSATLPIFLVLVGQRWRESSKMKEEGGFESRDTFF
jgi:hypothetical protein